MSPLTKRNCKQHWPGRQQGAVIVLVVIALAAILLMGALALDGGHMLLNKTRLQNAVDAAALSGAKTLQQSFGSGNASTLARAAALDALARNAAAQGNDELGDAIGTTAQAVADDTIVTLSNSVYGPFAFPGPTDAKYVRVSVPDYCLTGFFWRLAEAFGVERALNCDPGEKDVAAIATAGPSPSANLCKIDPLVVCANDEGNDPGNGFWGYNFGDLVPLTCGTPGSPSSGNCQLLRLGGMKGGDDIRQAFCSGVNECVAVGDSVSTEPGITWGPVAQGLNARLGIDSGSVENCPHDWYTDYSQPLVVLDGNTPEQNGNTVISNGGDLSAGGNGLIDVNDWLDASKSCAESPGSCDGEAERRVLRVVIGKCSAVAGGGATTVPVLGFGCFYLLQKVDQGGGGDKEVLGQFINECGGSGVAGPTPVEDEGPVIIQLYKTYIDDNRTPSNDS